MEFTDIARAFFIIGGPVLVVLGLFIYRVAGNIENMPTEIRYASTVNEAIESSGLYDEHGMVANEDDPMDIKAQSKKSDSFYESLI